jgi:hypothetical protein
MDNGYAILRPVFGILNSANGSPNKWKANIQGFCSFSQSNDPKEVDVSRRRQSGSGPSSSRRADTPSRQSDDSGRGSSSGGGGYQVPDGGGSRQPKIRLPLWLVIILIIGYFLIQMFSKSTPNEEVPTRIPEETIQPFFIIQATQIPQIQPTKMPQTTRLPSTGNTGQKWLVMLYQDADDKVLERDVMMDLNEAEMVGSTDQVQIVSQIDRYAGGYSGEGDWTTARRYYLQQDDDLLNLNSPMVSDLGEINMADGKTLVDFVTWAIDTYPADKYFLILSDHGMGWPGGWSDASARSKDPSSAPITEAIGDNIFLMELDKALSSIQNKAGLDKFELIGLDACLMSDIAVYTALEPYARYAVASQETEPGIGWAYTSFLKNLTENPGIDGSELGPLIVKSYVQDDERILDSRARADYMGSSSPLASLFGGSTVMTAAQLRDELEQDMTLTAVDLGKIPEVNSKLNELAYSLQGEKQSYIAKVRSYAQSYTSVWGKDVPPSYIDLGNFTQLLVNENISQKTITLADELQQAIKDAVIAEKHGDRKAGSNGISIYFPNSSLYSSDVAGSASYTQVANRFSTVSTWDDFLAYHYTNRKFKDTDALPVMPSKNEVVRSPGAGKIEISPISLSSDTVAPGSPVKMSATIKGNNVGYVYLFVGYYDRENSSIYAIDTDYLQSSKTREAGGVYYPDWPASGNFKISLSWDPTVFEISDGSTSEAVLLNPLTYGVSADQAVYTLDGVYTYADSGQQQYARLYFNQGKLRKVYGFTDEAGVGSPAEITPQTGDSFTIQETWLDLDANGKIIQTIKQTGKTLTFGTETFSWDEVFAAPGNYVLGFIVKDMDGNSTEEYAPITVQ